MIRTMVGSAFAGFQKAAVSGDYDEREIQLNNLRVDLRNLEGIVRQLMVELAATRQELQAPNAHGGTVTAGAQPAKAGETSVGIHGGEDGFGSFSNCPAVGVRDVSRWS